MDPSPKKHTNSTFTHLFVFFLYLSTDRMCEQSPDVGIETLVQRRHDETCPKIVALYDGRIWYGWEFMGSHILQLCPSTSNLKSKQNSSSQICLAISYQSYCLINRGDKWFLKRPVEFSPPAGRVLTKHSMARSQNPARELNCAEDDCQSIKTWTTASQLAPDSGVCPGNN